jgi:hypothetical protein
MIKWPITFTDYDDNEITEDFYFNLNKAELTQMQFDVNGAYSSFIERISNERDLKALGQEFKKIILMSYGKKSDDGRLFRKSEQMREDFEQSEAYVTLYMELLSDGEKAAKFVKGILPKDLQGQAQMAVSS